MLSTLDMCVGELMSKYTRYNLCITTSMLKQRLWEHFVDTSITNGKIVVGYLLNRSCTMFLCLHVLCFLCVVL